MLARYISTFLLPVLLLTNGKYSGQQDIDRATQYTGGRSTALQAIVRIGIADKVPLGLVFGSKQRLCNQEKDYNFKGVSTIEALRNVSEGTGYSVTVNNGVYNLLPPDLTQREEEVLRFHFPRFFAPPTTMADLGARLTGYVSTSVEGASGFVVNTLGNPDDEIVTVTMMTGITSTEVANEIVKLGSKGVWIMKAVRAETNPKPGSTLFDIYSYHDARTTLNSLVCPPDVTQ